MRKIIVICIVLTSCGGSLSDEQRKELKREMGKREIKKISQDEIFGKALELGRSIVSQLEGNPDSIAHNKGVEIFFADTLASDTLPTEYRQIFEAYAYTPDKSDLSDNVQDSGNTIIYSIPILYEGELHGVWFIDIPKKKIVLAL